ncbi:MAG: transcription antitermination factor NusB [Lactobacillales bacterium]|jgi:N utilization substance protein B|nr:transcription antitermination factor NusB [Lactobacillales bacterium]
MIQKLSRHQIREKALQTLFSMNFNVAVSKEDAIRYVLSYQVKDEENEIQPPDHLIFLVSEVIVNQEKLDHMIEKYLAKKWNLQRISKIELLILRMAVFEICYIDEANVPSVAAINEAVELAKAFGDESSSKFINGVLSNVLKEKC